jgi:nitroimidazol reductase NimA-like FMN-containing flavoprotein (pyridoxamine 5'-phosphate oxidase superfamily)
VSQERQNLEWMGKNAKLTPEELAEFLAGPVVARVATVDAEGRPYVTPVWQEWDGEAMWVVPRMKTLFVEHLRTNSNVAVSCAEDGGTYRRMTLRGKAEIISGPAPLEGQTLEVARRMARRYLGENGPQYLEPSIPRPRYLVKIVPDEIRTWDGVEWARHYLET